MFSSAALLIKVRCGRIFKQVSEKRQHFVVSLPIIERGKVTESKKACLRVCHSAFVFPPTGRLGVIQPCFFFTPANDSLTSKESSSFVFICAAQPNTGTKFGSRPATCRLFVNNLYKGLEKRKNIWQGNLRCSSEGMEG